MRGFTQSFGLVLDCPLREAVANHAGSETNHEELGAPVQDGDASLAQREVARLDEHRNMNALSSSVSMDLQFRACTYGPQNQEQIVIRCTV